MKHADEHFLRATLAYGRVVVASLGAICHALADGGPHGASGRAAVWAGAQRACGALLALHEMVPSVSIVLSDRTLFVEDVRVKASALDKEELAALTSLLRDRGIGAVALRAPTTQEDLVAFAQILMTQHTVVDVQSALLDLGIQSVDVDAQARRRDEGALERDDVEGAARLSYAKAAAAFEALQEALRAGQRAVLAPVVREVQILIDLLERDEACVVNLTTLRDPKVYTMQHAVNVTILSLLIGRCVGLDRRALRSLGIAAMLHDTGRLKLPDALLQKEDGLTPEEELALLRSPAEGAKLLLRMRDVGEDELRAVFVAAEHHLELDGSGPPALAHPRPPSPFSRIVHIADDFDALVSGLVFERRRLKPDHALAVMAARVGASYEPALFSAFADAVYAAFVKAS